MHLSGFYLGETPRLWVQPSGFSLGHATIHVFFKTLESAFQLGNLNF